MFFMMEPLEKKSIFFGFNGNRFAKQGGYYIYYEKNDEMQNYMLEEASVARREVREESGWVTEKEEKQKNDRCSNHK